MPSNGRKPNLARLMPPGPGLILLKCRIQRLDQGGSGGLPPVQVFSKPVTRKCKGVRTFLLEEEDDEFELSSNPWSPEGASEKIIDAPVKQGVGRAA